MHIFMCYFSVLEPFMKFNSVFAGNYPCFHSLAAFHPKIVSVAVLQTNRRQILIFFY